MDGILDVDVSQDLSVILELEKNTTKNKTSFVKSLPRRLSNLYCVWFLVRRRPFDVFQWYRVSMFAVSRADSSVGFS